MGPVRLVRNRLAPSGYEFYHYQLYASIVRSPWNNHDGEAGGIISRGTFYIFFRCHRDTDRFFLLSFPPVEQVI